MPWRPSSRPASVAFIIVLAVLLWGGGYVRRHLWEPDEARYAYIAWEAKQTGQWSILHRHGEIYSDKPPLMFWMINLFSLATGGRVNSISARLPSMLGAILSLWAVSRLAGQWHSRAAGWRAVLILATAPLFWTQGNTGQIDSLLCGLQMSALYWLLSSTQRPGAWRPLLAYGFMGLAVLAKGPVGVLVPLGVYLVSSLAAGEKASLKRTHWIWGPLVTAAFPAMWLAWAALNGAPQEYFSDLLFRQNVSRSAGALGHVQPVYYYLLHFPLELLPWTLFLPAAWFALRDPPEMTVLRRRLLGWALFVIAFFSMSPSKRQLYILLAYPAAAMLVAVSWDRIKGRWMKVAAHGAAAMVGLIGWGSLAAALYPRLPFSGWVLLPSGVAMAAGAGVLWATIRRRGPSTAWFATLTALLVWQEIALGAWILPALNPLKTPVELARAARDLLPADEKLLLYKINGEILAFYCGVQGKLLQNADELQAEIARRGRGIVAFEAADWASLQSRFAGTLVAHPFRMGNKKLVWCEFGGTGRPSPSHETD